MITFLPRVLPSSYEEAVGTTIRDGHYIPPLDVDRSNALGDIYARIAVLTAPLPVSSMSFANEDQKNEYLHAREDLLSALARMKGALTDFESFRREVSSQVKSDT